MEASSGGNEEQASQSSTGRSLRKRTSGVSEEVNKKLKKVVRNATLTEDQWTYKDLQKVEKRRRAALGWNNEYFLRILTHW